MDGITVNRSRILISSISAFPLIPYRPLRRISFLRLRLPTHPQPGAQNPQPAQTAKPQSSQASSPAAATDRHLSSILEHPLFSKSAVRTPHLDNGRDKNKGRIRRAPLSILDRLMASGRVDYRVLHRYIQAHLSTCAAGDNQGRSEGASRILSWHASADEESRLRFFASRSLMAAAMPCLISGGCQETVMEWLDFLCHILEGGVTFGMVEDLTLLNPRNLQFKVLVEFMAAEIKYGSIESAMSYFLRSCDVIVVENDKFHVREGARSPLRVAGALVAKETVTRCRKKEAGSIPVQLFDAFVDTLSSGLGPYWACRLRLFHPSNPQVGPVVEYLMSQTAIKKYWWDNSRRRRLLSQLCLDTLELCIEQEKFATANRVVLLAKPLFTEEGTKRHSPQASSALNMLSQMHVASLASQ